MNIQDKKVELFYDLIDKACMILYEELRLNYLDAFFRVSNDLLNGINETNLDGSVINRLEKIYNSINNTDFYNEEIRLAIELLLVKAYKHINQSISFMTPDTICYIFAYLIRYKVGINSIIIDTALGVGNLVQAIANNSHQELTLIGIENDLNAVNSAIASSNLQNNEITIYYQDALKNIFERADIVIGDLDSYEYNGEYETRLTKRGIKYFPYLVMYERLENLVSGGYFFYLIDNDFFSQKKVEEFRIILGKKATLVGLVTLPDSLFIGDKKKSILIGKKKVLEDYQMSIVNITSLKSEYIEEAYVRLRKMIERI